MNRVLVDTQAFIFAVANSPAISKSARSTLEDPEVEKLLSQVSVWEVAIKLNLGKLRLPEPLGPLLQRLVSRGQISLLQIRTEHVLAVESLPRHHGDPFDRLIAATCLHDNLDLLSNDAAFDAYGVHRVW